MTAIRRLDLLQKRIDGRKATAAQTTGGQCHDDPAHLAQVIEALYSCGALPDVLARAGLTLDDIGMSEELSPVGNLPHRARR